MKKSQKSQKSSWIVRVQETVIKELVCLGCTEDQAKNDPFLYADSENEIGSIDYEVIRVEENI